MRIRSTTLIDYTIYMYNNMYSIQWQINILKSFRFSLVKKGAGADSKIPAPAPDQILNRLQLKNLGSGSAKQAQKRFFWSAQCLVTFARAEHGIIIWGGSVYLPKIRIRIIFASIWIHSKIWSGCGSVTNILKYCICLPVPYQMHSTTRVNNCT